MKTDVIVVFGSAVYPGGQPSPAMVRRVCHGVNLMKKLNVPYLLLSGGIGKHPPAEALVMADIAQSQGIHPSSIILECRSTSTFENVKFSLRLMEILNLTHPIVVSDGYHLPRIRLTFRYFGKRVQTRPAPGPECLKSKKQWCFNLLREGCALIYYGLWFFKNRDKKP